MAKDPVSAWLDAAARYPLLPKEETLRLARQIRAWQDHGENPRAGKRALDKMVQHNLRLVPSVWKKFSGHINSTDESALDLLQCGAIGIRTAAIKFDPTRGYEFSTVAYQWIRKEIQDWNRRYERTIRVASDCQSIGGQYPYWVAKFEAKHGRPPTKEESCERFKVKPKTLDFYLSRWEVTKMTSLNRRIANVGRGSDEPEIMDLVEGSDINEVVDNSRKEEMQRLIAVIAQKADLEIDEVYDAMEWKGTQPAEIKAMRRRIGIVSRYLKKTRPQVREMLKD